MKFDHSSDIYKAGYCLMEYSIALDKDCWRYMDKVYMTIPHTVPVIEAVWCGHTVNLGKLEEVMANNV